MLTCQDVSCVRIAALIWRWQKPERTGNTSLSDLDLFVFQSDFRALTKYPSGFSFLHQLEFLFWVVKLEQFTPQRARFDQAPTETKSEKARK